MSVEPVNPNDVKKEKWYAEVDRATDEIMRNFDAASKKLRAERGLPPEEDSVDTVNINWLTPQEIEDFEKAMQEEQAGK